MKYHFDEQAMNVFGEKLGRAVEGGQVIELIGDVGAGKTTLTKALARGMGITGNIQSPTFTISNQYDAPSGLRLIHYDFYRLNEAGIMADELIEEKDDDKAVIIIEWGDIIRDALEDDHLTIRIMATAETERDVEIEASGEKSRGLQEQLT
ncbi:MAG: tRNA (adenosine(37)-N6)-threonylcarbamoyltransferase complex ATPase subunit type 1 TsaE [Candidatus Saccharimonadales bacterium]